MTRTFVALGLLVILTSAIFSQEKKDGPAVVELLEDDTDGLMGQLLNDGGLDDTKIMKEYRDVYSGTSAIRVTPFQRFTSRVNGWSYPIVEKPGPGEYRYVRFAWKRLEGTGTMIQFHNPTNGSWNQRYYAGEVAEATLTWGAMLQVAKLSPNEWVVVTRDLFKDFGAFTLGGIALTPMYGGSGGLFDHFYLGRSIEDLDLQSSLVFGKTPLKERLSREKLALLWRDLASREDATASPALRSLLAGRKESVAYLAEMVQPLPQENLDKRIAKLIEALDDERFRTRENAHKELDQLGEVIVPLLEKTFAETKSLEVRRRVSELLKKHSGSEGAMTPDQLRLVRVIRILEWSGSPEAREVLEKMTKRTLPAGLNKEARQSLLRLK